MRLINIIDEDFINYKIPSMNLIFPKCSMKCNKDAGYIVCQNHKLIDSPTINISYDDLCKRYLSNSITSAIVCHGLEPFDSRRELFCFIKTLREKYNCKDTVVIYTGYTEEELESKISNFLKLGNLIIKYGRYIPDDEFVYDELLGVTLASKNQYAKFYK